MYVQVESVHFKIGSTVKLSVLLRTTIRQRHFVKIRIKSRDNRRKIKIEQKLLKGTQDDDKG